MYTGFSFSFLVFHRVMTRVNDATNSSSIRLWYPIPFHKFELLSQRLRREGELQLLREKNVSQRGEVELWLFLQGEVEWVSQRERSSCGCFCEERMSRE